MKKTESQVIEELSALSIDCGFTPFDWEGSYIKEWKLVFPDTSSMSVQNCILLLNTRDEIESVRARLSEDARADLWRFEVVQSDLENK